MAGDASWPAIAKMGVAREQSFAYEAPILARLGESFVLSLSAEPNR